jgi:hypothetical protein
VRSHDLIRLLNKPVPCAVSGRPENILADYQADMGVINADAGKIYRYMNFDQVSEHKVLAEDVDVERSTRSKERPARRNPNGPFSWQG